MEYYSFWKDRFDLNRTVSLPYQWKQYEEKGTIDNFRITAGLKTGQRRGFFYTDSDLHKWADAVCRTLSSERDSGLEELLNYYLLLMKESQEEDGYLFTFNQINFPGRRWENLLIEHELYCLGHFIEAGVEHALWSGNNQLLDLAEKTAVLICRDFAGTKLVPGHQEIEYALLRLCDLCGNRSYRETALNFLYNRGRNFIPAYRLMKDFSSHKKKLKQISGSGGADQSFSIDDADLPGLTAAHRRRNLQSYLNGQYMQRHKPVTGQTEPMGHAVRWAYQTAAAARSGADDLTAAAESSWLKMVTTKMYVSGGVGALPLVEGFGKAYELPNDTAYCETCAAVGSIFLAGELFSSSREALYMDVLDWQLYNAALTGMGADGKSYFYANPLASNGGLERKPWFNTACCPSNISRLFGSLHRFAVQENESGVFVCLYIDGEYRIHDGLMSVKIRSGIPWEGSSEIRIENKSGQTTEIFLRIPGWAASGTIDVDGTVTRLTPVNSRRRGLPDFESSRFFPVQLTPGGSSEIRLSFDMPVRLLPADDRVRDNRGKIAVYRGPLLYCVEYDSNIGEEIVITTDSLEYAYDPTIKTGIIKAVLRSGEAVGLIPYYYWGNSENPKEKKMRVWLESD